MTTLSVKHGNPCGRALTFQRAVISFQFIAYIFTTRGIHLGMNNAREGMLDL